MSGCWQPFSTQNRCESPIGEADGDRHAGRAMARQVARPTEAQQL